MSDSLLSLARANTAAEGELRLPSRPGRIRTFWARHPWFVDSLIAVLYGIPAIIGTAIAGTLFASPTDDPTLVVRGIVLATLSTTAVLLRRRIPLVALGLATGSAALMFSTSNFILFGVCLLLYAVAIYRSNRSAWIGLAISGTVLFASSLIPIPASFDVVSTGREAIPSAVFLILATLIGVNVGNNKRYLAALTDRATQLVRERDQQALLATAAERARIAREMHDIVSHSLTVMVALADGSAALVESDPARSEVAMRRSAETGREALTDMRRMLGVLSDDSADDDGTLAPQPDSSDVTQLIETFREAGLPIRVTVSGSAPLDHGRQLAVYRTVQESLTNALRYAPDATTVVVNIHYSPETVAITVTDNGLGVTPAGQGVGRGLVGIGERVALYGGTVESGPHGDQGWRVHAEFAAVEGNGA